MEKQSKKKCHYYAREFKMKVSDWYMNNGKNIAMTAQMLEVDRKQVKTWLKNEFDELFNNKNILVKPLGEVVQQNIRLWRTLYILSTKKQEQKENF